MTTPWATRRLELSLVLFALAVIGLGYYAVARGRDPQADWRALAPVLALAPGWLAAHLLLRRSRRPSDPLMLPVVVMLAGVGQIMLFRLQPGLVVRHTMLLGVAQLGMCALAAFPAAYQGLGRYRYSTMALGMALLLGTTLFGRTVHGVQLSLDLGVLSFQPSELVKLFLVAFMAAHLADKRELLRFSGGGIGLSPLDLRYLGPMLGMWALAVMLIVVQGDLGAALILYGIFLVMLYLGEDRRAHLIIAMVAFAGAAWVGYQHVAKVQTRLDVWLDPWATPHGSGYQIVQSMLALGYGRLTGAGLGAGFPQDIPAAHTDFVFAAFAEEVGLAGALALLALYLVLIWRGLRAALRSGDDFSALLAGGLSGVLALQTLIITGGICRLLPLTGITLPFISYGGTSLLANALLVGMLLAVSGGTQTAPGWARLPARRVRRLLGLVVLGVLALSASLVYWQVIRSDDLFAYQYNRRPFHLEARVPRGSLLDRHNLPLAQTRPGEGREYPFGEALAPVIGYYSRRYGRVNLERTLDPWLAGTRSVDLRDRLDALLDDRYRGADVRLTLDSRLQEIAYRALAGHRGAVAAIQPATGEVLALASRPSFDPALIDTGFDRLARAKPAVLIDRALQGLYPPGSSFKVVVAAAALQMGISPDWTYYCRGSTTIGGHKISCYHGAVHGYVTIPEALTVSCNCAFATLAGRVGQDAIAAMAEGLGFQDRWEHFVLPVSASRFPQDFLPPSQLAQVGFGQASIVATPFQMALVAAAVANHGTLMAPYLVDRITSPTRGTVSRTEPRVRVQAMAPQVADQVATMMVSVVDHGTGTGARLSRWVVAGKTGTAQNPHGADHAWFICFAPAEQPRVALAVVLENAGPGGRAAAPVARKILQEYLGE